MTAIGGGALIAAVALVLIPHGLDAAPLWAIVAAFFAGGGTAMAIDIALSKQGGTLSQLAAMLLDFIPETIVIGAIIARNRSEAVLLAVIIFAQNLPESFTAFREMRESARTHPGKLIAAFGLIGASGPLYMVAGALLFAERDLWLGLLTIFCGGGILYLVFRDVAPQAKLENRFLPQMGALAGFAIGMIGEQIAG